MKQSFYNPQIERIGRGTMSHFSERDNSLLTAVFITGSLIRGDYDQKTSDQDFLIVFQNSTSPTSQKEIVDDFIQYGVTENIFTKPDILYINEQNIPRTKNEKLTTPFSKFSIFGFDTKENYYLVYGDNILGNFQPLKPEKCVDDFLDHFIQKAGKATSHEELSITTCQIIRCLFIKNGIVTLHKELMRDSLSKLPYDTDIKTFISKHPYLSRSQRSSHFSYTDSRDFIEKVNLLLNNER